MNHSASNHPEPNQFELAEGQFQEIITFLGGDAAATGEPEKYYLYTGLMNMARGMAQVERKLDLLRRGE